MVRRVLNSHKDLDFVLLQEVRAIKFTLEINLNFIWKDSLKFFTKHEKGKRWVAILINRNWRNSILCFGVSPCNRAAWVTFQYGDSSFGLCNIYAPNDYRDRAELWKWLASLSNIPWILGGDFNMVEHKDEKLGGVVIEWKGGEKPHWDKMKNMKRFFDALEGLKHVHKGIWFTWCNFQKVGNKIYSRLDRFYTNRDFLSFILDHQGYLVVVKPSSLSDYHPIFVEIVTRSANKPHSKVGGKLILNNNLLKDQDILTTVHIVRMFNKWNPSSGSYINNWDTSVKSWQKILGTIGKKKAKDAKQVELVLSSNLHNVEQVLQNDPSNSHFTHQVEVARDEIRKQHHHKALGARTRAKMLWLSQGDKGSKLFFNLLKQKQCKENISYGWMARKFLLMRKSCVSSSTSTSSCSPPRTLLLPGLLGSNVGLLSLSLFLPMRLTLLVNPSH